MEEIVHRYICVLRSLVKSMRHGVSESLLNVVREKIRGVNDAAHRLLLKIAKMKNMRDRVLTYFSTVLHLNLNREKIFSIQLQATCSSPGFINNFLYILLKFC